MLLALLINADLFIITLVPSKVKAGNNFSFKKLHLENKINRWP